MIKKIAFIVFLMLLFVASFVMAIHEIGEIRENQVKAFNMEQTITYNLQRGSTLEDAFTELERISDDEIIFYFDEDINLSQSFRMSAQDKTFESVKNLVLQLNDLETTRLSDQLYHVYPREKREEYEEEHEEKNYIEQEYDLEFIESEDLVDQLKEQYEIDRFITGEHSLFLRYEDSQRSSLEESITILDQESLQAEIEITILEFERTEAQRAGIEWNPISGESLMETVLNVGFDDSDYATYPARVEAEHLDTYSEVVSNPTIRAENKKESRIFLGESIPQVRRYSDEDESVVEIDYEDVGIDLNVTPHIRKNKEVTLDVDLAIENLGESEGTFDGINAYRKHSKEIDTTITIQNENSIVIGGLISDELREEHRRIPLLSNIPGLGRLFEIETHEPEKSEIIMLITPKIIDINEEIPTNIKLEEERMKIDFDLDDHLKKLN